MSLASRLHTTLELLDEGFALYRRNFTGFLLIGATWLTPLAIGVGLLVAFADRLTDTIIGFMLFIGLLLALPLLVYLVGGLSRGATAAIEGRPVRLGQALSIHPGSAMGAGCFTIIYSFIVQLASSMISFICICPLYIFGFAFAAVLSDVNGGAEAAALILFGILFGGVYLMAMIIGGASYSSMFYALQPWVQERLSFSAAMERSVDLVIFRFRSNLVVWALSALLLTAAGFSTSLAVGVLAPLPALVILGAESSLAQAIASGAWLIGLALVLPPLPIWMTLLYRRNMQARTGSTLEQQIEEWEKELSILG